MAKIYPEMLEIGRPPRLEPAMRRAAAREANKRCCVMLNAMVDERFPHRIANPSALGALAARVAKMQEAFFEEAAFLFDIAACRGLREEPTQSVRDAFAFLLDSETVHNTRGWHEAWESWHTGRFGDDHIFLLFDQSHAESVKSPKDPDTAATFFRAFELLKRINTIALHVEDPVSTSIMDIMPEAIRLSLASAVDYKKAAFERPWMMVTEEYAVYRCRLSDELGFSNKTLSNYEKDGKTSKGTFWPAPLNPGDRHGTKYYDPMKVLEALTLLPKDFSRRTRVDDIIAMLLDGKLSSKILPQVPKKLKKETEGEEIAREAETVGWQKEYSVWDASTMTRKNGPE